MFVNYQYNVHENSIHSLLKNISILFYWSHKYAYISEIVCGLTHSFIEWTNLAWSQMGDLSKIVFSQKLLINLVRSTYNVTNSVLFLGLLGHYS